MPGNSAALVTISIGEQHRAIAELTHPLMQDYAARCGMDFRPVFERSTKADPDFEKLAAHELLAAYNRVLIIDSDVVITPEAGNILEMVPPSSFGAYLVSRHTNMHDRAIALIQEVLQSVGWNGNDYFNAGVMVASQDHRPLFDPSHRDLGIWQEVCARRPEYETFLAQTYLNYRLQADNVPFFDIGYRFNHSLGPGRSDQRFGSDFIHCKGHRKGTKRKEIERALFVLNHARLRRAFSKHPVLTRLYDRIA